MLLLKPPTQSCHISPVLKSLHWLKINERIDCKLLSLTSPTSSLYSYFLCCHPCSPSSQLLVESHQPFIPTCITPSLEQTFCFITPALSQILIISTVIINYKAKNIFFQKNLLYHIHPHASTGLTSWTSGCFGFSLFDGFYPNVTTLRSGLCYRNSVCSVVCLSSVCLSVVCNVGGPYSGGWSFRQYFFTAVYAGHPLTSVQNFMDIVPAEPLHWER